VVVVRLSGRARIVYCGNDPVFIQHRGAASALWCVCRPTPKRGAKGSDAAVRRRPDRDESITLAVMGATLHLLATAATIPNRRCGRHAPPKRRRVVRAARHGPLSRTRDAYGSRVQPLEGPRVRKDYNGRAVDRDADRRRGLDLSPETTSSPRYGRSSARTRRGDRCRQACGGRRGRQPHASPFTVGAGAREDTVLSLVVTPQACHPVAPWIIVGRRRDRTLACGARDPLARLSRKQRRANCALLITMDGAISRVRPDITQGCLRTRRVAEHLSDTLGAHGPLFGSGVPVWKKASRS